MNLKLRLSRLVLQKDAKKDKSVAFFLELQTTQSATINR